MPYHILLFISHKHQAKIACSIHTRYACLLLSTLMQLDFFKISWESPCLGEALESAKMLVIHLFLEGVSKMAPESYASLSIWQPSGTSRELGTRQAERVILAYSALLKTIYIIEIYPKHNPTPP